MPEKRIIERVTVLVVTGGGNVDRADMDVEYVVDTNSHGIRSTEALDRQVEDTVRTALMKRAHRIRNEEAGA